MFESGIPTKAPTTAMNRPRQLRRNAWYAEDMHRPAAADNAPILVSAETVLREERFAFGAVFIISLDDIFRSLGGRTGRLADALRLMGESLLRMRLGPDERFSYHADGLFRFRLRDPDLERARLRAERIVDELGRRAIGTRFITWESLREEAEALSA